MFLYAPPADLIPHPGDDAGLLVLPFALVSLSPPATAIASRPGSAAQRSWAGSAACSPGRRCCCSSCTSGPAPDPWLLAGPLPLAWVGNGLVIAPDQDFVLGSVPRREARTAGGALIPAQRLGAVIGNAVIGTVLFGSGSGESSSGKVTLGLPRTLGSERAEENA